MNDSVGGASQNWRILTQFSGIRVAGEDSAQFLQGQLTCDVRAIGADQAVLAAFCNPKGRVISTLLVAKAEWGYVLMLPTALLDTVLKKLQIYVLRAKVTLAALTPPAYLLGAADGQAPARPPQNAALCAVAVGSQRRLAMVESAEPPPADAAAWLIADLQAGIPWFEASQSELYTPQMLNLDNLGAVSFTKGCYTGQEVVARTHYLGQAKRHLYRAAPAAGPLPAGGCKVFTAAGAEVGAVLAAAGNETAAVLLVLQDSGAEMANLFLDGPDRTAINLI